MHSSYMVPRETVLEASCLVALCLHTPFLLILIADEQRVQTKRLLIFSLSLLYKKLPATFVRSDTPSPFGSGTQHSLGPPAAWRAVPHDDPHAQRRRVPVPPHRAAVDAPVRVGGQRRGAQVGADARGAVAPQLEVGRRPLRPRRQHRHAERASRQPAAARRPLCNKRPNKSRRMRVEALRPFSWFTSRRRPRQEVEPAASGGRFRKQVLTRTARARTLLPTSNRAGAVLDAVAGRAKPCLQYVRRTACVTWTAAERVAGGGGSGRRRGLVPRGQRECELQVQLHAPGRRARLAGKGGRQRPSVATASTYQNRRELHEGRIEVVSPLRHNRSVRAAPPDLAARHSRQLQPRARRQRDVAQRGRVLAQRLHLLDGPLHNVRPVRGQLHAARQRLHGEGHTRASEAGRHRRAELHRGPGWGTERHAAVTRTFAATRRRACSAEGRKCRRAMAAYLQRGPASVDVALLRVCLVYPPKQDSPPLHGIVKRLGSIVLHRKGGRRSGCQQRMIVAIGKAAAMANWSRITVVLSCLAVWTGPAARPASSRRAARGRDGPCRSRAASRG